MRSRGSPPSRVLSILGSLTSRAGDGGIRRSRTRGLWDGLPNLERLARTIRLADDSPFATLHAAQLIKHALGLRHSYGDGFKLVYLWHRLAGTVEDAHAREVERFAGVAQSELTFVAVTVGHALNRFDPGPDSQAWFDFMIARYLSPERR